MNHIHVVLGGQGTKKIESLDVMVGLGNGPMGCSSWHVL
jgi:hypothetical protein